MAFNVTLMTAILLVFYLFLLVKWENVRRPIFYVIGAGGLLLGLIGMFFDGFRSEWSGIVLSIFNSVGGIVAFLGAVAACYGCELPGEKESSEQTQGGAGTAV